jgi:S1-C subfamily serine protease
MRRVHRVSCVLSALVVMLIAVDGGLRAELRTWTAATGGYSVEADFVELVDGRVVRLKRAGGDVLDVPLDKLSAADQTYVKQKQAGAAAGPAGAKSERLTRATLEAERCRSAQDALRIYKVFAEAPESTAADRAAVAARIAELEPLAEKKLYRVAGKWITEAEAEQVRKQANELMRQGLEVLKLGQEDTFRKKFAAAGALEPEEVRADFMLGVLYSTSNQNKNMTRAVQYYQACYKRAPTNVAVLNNLALMYVKTGDFNGALQLWTQAMAIVPDQRICHNIGKLVKLASNETVTVSKAVLPKLTELYLTNIGEGKLKPTDPARGWLHLLVDGADLDLDLDKTTQRADVVPPPSGDGQVVGGGTGFAIDAQHIVTNAHVVDGGSSYEVQLGNATRNETVRATVVAVSEKPDLAILRVETTFDKPVTFDPQPCSRGTDIMVLGYPEMFELGATLKATRGVISGLPSPALDNLYLYDAVTNGGNSGGPVCDAKGNIVAVHCIGVNTASRYGGGIPAAEVLAFVQKSLPDYKPQTPTSATLDWPAVDRQVSPATVLVWVRKRDGAPTTAIAGALEDRSCLGCKGVGATKCLNGGCVNGVMTIRVSGRSVKGECVICKGTGVFPCLHCKGEGIDRDVKSAMASSADTPVAAGDPASQPTNNPPSQPTNNAPTNNRPTTSTRRVVDPRGAVYVASQPSSLTEPAAARGKSSGVYNVRGDVPAQHPPLSATMAAHLRDAIAGGQTSGLGPEASSTRHQAFREVSPAGALLIGFDLSFFKYVNTVCIQGYRPIYLTERGKVEGQWRGGRGGPGFSNVHLEARPGYAVGKVFVRTGIFVDNLCLTYMRIGATGLDPNDSYESNYYGGDGAGRTATWGDGSPIVGIQGMENSSDARCLGIVTVPNGP